MAKIRCRNQLELGSIYTTTSDLPAAPNGASAASVPLMPGETAVDFLEIQSRILCYQGDVKSLGDSYAVRKWMNARRELRKARREMRLLIRKRNSSLAFDFLK